MRARSLNYRTSPRHRLTGGVRACSHHGPSRLPGPPSNTSFAPWVDSPAGLYLMYSEDTVGSMRAVMDLRTSLRGRRQGLVANCRSSMMAIFLIEQAGAVFELSVGGGDHYHLVAGSLGILLLRRLNERGKGR